MLESVSEEEIIDWCVSDFKICLVKLNLSGGSLGWSLGLALGIDLSGWIQDLIQFGLGLGDNIGCPLTQILKIVNKLKFIKLSVRFVNLSLFCLHFFSSGFLGNQIGKGIEGAGDGQVVQE